MHFLINDFLNHEFFFLKSSFSYIFELYELHLLGDALHHDDGVQVVPVPGLHGGSQKHFLLAAWLHSLIATKSRILL